MTPEAAVEAARRLAEARRTGTLIAELPAHCAPQNLGEAYRVQGAFTALWGQPIAAWKAGATAKAIQAKLGIDGPFLGPVFMPDIIASPAAVPSRRFPHLCVESEFAFRIGRALSPREDGYCLEEVVDAVDALVPAIEIISPRFAKLPLDRIALGVADCGLNGALVLGSPLTDWRGVDLAAHKVKLAIGGKPRTEGTGANVLGDPLVSLDWTVNTLTRGGVGLTAGQLISTGSCTGMEFASAGDTAVADFGRLGSVSVTFAGTA